MATTDDKKNLFVNQKATLDKKMLDLHEKHFSSMSWGSKMVISVIVDLIDFFMFIPGVNIVFDVIAGFVSRALWGDIGFLAFWEAFPTPPMIDGLVPTLTIIGLLDRSLHKKDASVKTIHRVDPELIEFCQNLGEKFKEFWYSFHVDPELVEFCKHPKQVVKDFWQDVCLGWELLGQWAKDKIIQPVTSKLSIVIFWQKVKVFVQSFWRGRLQPIAIKLKFFWRVCLAKIKEMK